MGPQPGWAVMTGRQSGMAIIEVIGATAALAALVSITALGAAGSAAAAAYRAQATQAEWLAEITVQQGIDALGAGTVPAPGPGVGCHFVNGIDQGSGAAFPVGVLPSPVTTWPPVTGTPGPSTGRGTVLRIVRVVGPDGAGRGRGGVADTDPLVDLEAEAWFRNARDTVVARVSIGAAGVTRLH